MLMHEKTCVIPIISQPPCMLGNFSCFWCRLLNFPKVFFFKNSFRNTVRVSKGLDPDQDRPIVGPDLGTNCLQRLSADDKTLC